MKNSAIKAMFEIQYRNDLIKCKDTEEPLEDAVEVKFVSNEDDTYYYEVTVHMESRTNIIEFSCKQETKEFYCFDKRDKIFF